ncbi:MAG TPA: glycosyltransferase family 39 protein [Bryobacteraceae bacterium]|nr:glycosyltransferase family 39 protein [Bryobacteraceae bacterium]
MQALSIIFGAVFTLAVSYALGSRLLREAATDPGLRVVCGGAILSTLVFACCATGLARPATFLVLGFGALAFSKLPGKRPALFDRRWWLVLAPFVVLYLSNAMAPEISFDGSRYHLGLVARYLREHGFHPIHDNFYAALPAGIEMLYLFAFAFGRHSAAATVHFGLLLALAWQIFAWARRAGYPLAGMCAAALVFLSPVVGVDGTSAYNDVALAAIAFSLFHALWLWDEQRSSRLLAAIGLLAGFAFAAKYTAALAVPYAVGWVAWKSRRRARDLAIVAGLAALVIAPWLFKNWLWYRNPLAPFFNQWFPNPYVTVSFEREYRSQFTHWNGADGVIGPVLFLAPLGLMALRSNTGRRLWMAAAVFGVPVFANASPRFLIPALPFAALAMCMVLARIPRLAVALVIAQAVLSWPPVLRRYCRSDAWHLNKVTYREALRIKPEEGYLESNLPLYGAARLVERLTPAGATVFTQTPIPEAYTARHIQTAYQAAGNIMSRDILWSGFVPEHAPTRRLLFRFPRQPLRGIRLVQMATATGTWSIHEVRAFDADRELPRDGWSASARPFPWGSEAMLDGRLASFWRCGDTLRAGQTAEIEFHTIQPTDTVVVEAAPDQPELRLALNSLDGRLLAAAPEVQDVPLPFGMRRAAAAELHRRGIDYLLVMDGEFGADDLKTADWGIRQVGEYKGARLYQLP